MKKTIYTIFAVSLLTTTLGCPPPAPPANVNTDTSVEVAPPSDNGTGSSETPSDNATGAAETPSDNTTGSAETP